MPDITAISGLLTSLKVSADLTKAIIGLRDAELVRQKANELTAQILAAHQFALAAQTAQSELIERERALKEEVMDLKRWDREKKRYRLDEVAPGSFAYTTKPGKEAGEPPHKICANCYQGRRKSILQGVRRTSGWYANGYLVCPACKAEIVVASTFVGPSGGTTRGG